MIEINRNQSIPFQIYIPDCNISLVYLQLLLLGKIIGNGTINKKFIYNLSGDIKIMSKWVGFHEIFLKIVIALVVPKCVGVFKYFLEVHVWTASFLGTPWWHIWLWFPENINWVKKEAKSWYVFPTKQLDVETPNASWSF